MFAYQEMVYFSLQGTDGQDSPHSCAFFDTMRRDLDLGDPCPFEPKSMEDIVYTSKDSRKASTVVDTPQTIAWEDTTGTMETRAASAASVFSNGLKATGKSRA